MQKWLVFLFFISTLSASPSDQFLVLFGAPGYVLYKVLDFANDHGVRYIKILSYEFTGFSHTASATCHSPRPPGRYFELQDDYSKISFLCLDTRPIEDIYIIDTEKYRYLLREE